MSYNSTWSVRCYPSMCIEVFPEAHSTVHLVIRVKPEEIYTLQLEGMFSIRTFRHYNCRHYDDVADFWNTFTNHVIYSSLKIFFFFCRKWVYWRLSTVCFRLPNPWTFFTIMHVLSIGPSVLRLSRLLDQHILNISYFFYCGFSSFCSSLSSYVGRHCSWDYAWCFCKLLTSRRDL